MPSTQFPYSRPTEDGSTRLILPTPSNRYLLFGALLWLVAWGVGLYEAILVISGSGFGLGGYAALDGFLLTWLLLWLAAGAFAVVVLLWGFFGSEIITRTDERLSVQRAIFGIGPTRTFDRRGIDNLRTRAVKTDFFSARSKWSVWGLGPGKVQFRYRGKSYSLGLGLTDEEAEHLVELLR